MHARFCSIVPTKCGPIQEDCSLSERADDDPAREQLLKNGGAVTDFHQNKIGRTRHER